MKVDVLQVFISTAAILGIGFMCTNFDEKVFHTIWDLMKAPFIERDSVKEKEGDHESDDKSE